MKILNLFALCILIPITATAAEQYCYVDRGGDAVCIDLDGGGTTGGGGCGGSSQCGSNDRPLEWVPDYIESTKAPLINRDELLKKFQQSKTLQLERLQKLNVPEALLR